MVLPEGTRDESRRRRSSRSGLTVLAGASIVIGVFAIGALTSPEPGTSTIPEAVPEPSSTTSTTVEPGPSLVDVATFDVTEIESGAPLAWELTLPLQFRRVISLVNHEGWLYVFADATPSWAERAGGLQAWRSVDGLEWKPLGTVIGRAVQIGEVTATGQGLVATSLSRTPNGLDIWISDDGVDWERQQLMQPDAAQNAYVFANAVYGDGEKLVITAALEFDIRALLERQLRETGVDVDLSRNHGWGAEETADGVRFTIYGPLGIVIHQATASELGMSAAEAQLAVSGFSQSSETLVWVSTSDGDWIESSIQGSPWVNDMAATPDGELLAFGFGTRGPTVWRSRDGISWVESGLVLSPRSAQLWGNRLIGPSDSSAWVMISEDGASWEHTSLHEHFPAPISWQVQELVAGDSGVAAVVEGWAQTTLVGPERPDSPTITRKGVTLTMDFDRGEFEVDTGDDTHAWGMFRGSLVPEGMNVDLVAGTVGFSDPGTGKPLIEVTFEDLEGAEQEYWLGKFDERSFTAFAYSPDGETWSVQDAHDIFGEDPGVSHVAMTPDRMVAVVERLAGTLRPDGPMPTSEVWTAPIP